MTGFFSWVKYPAFYCAAMFFFACSPPDGKGADEKSEESKEAQNAVVNLYSSRHYDTDLALYSNFTDQTGIKVNRIEAGADALIERIKREGEFSPADLLITVDAGRLWRAEQAGILSPLQSDLLTQRIPEHIRHPEGLWFGLSKRARLIIYNKATGRPEQLDNYLDLAHPDHRGKICMRSSGNIYNVSLLASLITNEGPATAQEWAEGVVANFARKPQSNDSGQIEAVAAGLCEISMVNSYYLARYASAEDSEKHEIFEKIGIIFPNQNGRGTHINISGAGLAAHAPNRANAIKFLEYLTSAEAQAYFANGNNEYPAVKTTAGAAMVSVVENLGQFKEDKLNMSALGEHQAEAARIFDQAGWQ